MADVHTSYPDKQHSAHSGSSATAHTGTSTNVFYTKAVLTPAYLYSASTKDVQSIRCAQEGHLDEGLDTT